MRCSLFIVFTIHCHPSLPFPSSLYQSHYLIIISHNVMSQHVTAGRSMSLIINSSAFSLFIFSSRKDI